MHEATFVVLLALACCVLLTESSNLMKYAYIISPTPFNVPRLAYGWLQMACLRTPCVIETRLKDNQYTVVRIYREAKVLKREFLAQSPGSNDSLLRQRVDSSEEMNVVATIVNPPPVPGDQGIVSVFGMNPILEDDKIFVMNVPTTEEFILLVARDGNTKVKMTMGYAGMEETLKQEFTYVKRYSGKFIFLQHNTKKMDYEIILRAEKPIAVYYGFEKIIRGSIPSVRTAGREFVFGALDQPSLLVVWVYAPTCTSITYTSLGTRMSRTETDVTNTNFQTDCTGLCRLVDVDMMYLFKIEKAIKISSEADVIVRVTYMDYYQLRNGPVRLNAFCVIPPLQEFNYEYIIRNPVAYQAYSDLAIPEPKVIVIVKDVDFQEIFINRGRFSRYVEKKGGHRTDFRISDKECYYLFSNVPFPTNNVIHFNIRPFHYRKPSYGVFVYSGPSEPHLYLSAVGVYSSNKVLQSERPRGEGKFHTRNQRRPVPLVFHGRFLLLDFILNIDASFPKLKWMNWP